MHAAAENLSRPQSGEPYPPPAGPFHRLRPPQELTHRVEARAGAHALSLNSTDIASLPPPSRQISTLKRAGSRFRQSQSSRSQVRCEH